MVLPTRAKLGNKTLHVGGQTVSQLEPTLSNLDKVGGQTIPNVDQVANVAQVGSPVWPGLHLSLHLLYVYFVVTLLHFTLLYFASLQYFPFNILNLLYFGIVLVPLSIVFNYYRPHIDQGPKEFFSTYWPTNRTVATADLTRRLFEAQSMSRKANFERKRLILRRKKGVQVLT